MELGRLKAEVEDDHIVVTLPGTAFKTIYFRAPDEPKLVQAPSMAVNKNSVLSHREFETLAWEAGNAKARELGWF